MIEVAFIGAQPNPSNLRHLEDAMSRHQGALPAIELTRRGYQHTWEKFAFKTIRDLKEQGPQRLRSAFSFV